MSKTYTIFDLSETARTLLFFKEDLTDNMNCLCEEWIDEVRDLIKKHKNKETVTQEEINSLVEWHNDICKEEAYPSLLPQE